MAETSSFFQKISVEWEIKNHLAVERLESEKFYLDGAQWMLIFESNFQEYRKKYGFRIQKLQPVGSYHEFLLKSFAEDKKKNRHLVDNTHLVIVDSLPADIRWIWNEDLRKKNKEIIINKAVTFIFDFKSIKKSETEVSFLGEYLFFHDLIISLFLSEFNGKHASALQSSDSCKVKT